jgi:hypothetical protein
MSTRPELPDCADTSDVAVPASDDQADSAVDCLLASHAAGDGAELEFTLTIGEDRHEAILQTLEDGRVNYFRRYPMGGWGFHVNCSQLDFPPGGIPDVDDCEAQYVPAGN